MIRHSFIIGKNSRPMEPASIDTRFAGSSPPPSPFVVRTRREGFEGEDRFSTSIETYERLIRKTARFARFSGPAGTLETVRKGRGPRRSRTKRRTWQEGRPRVFQDQAVRWPRVISRRRRRRSTTRRFNTPWIATRNVSTFTFYCSLFARLLPLSPRFTTLKTRTPRPLSASCPRSRFSPPPPRGPDPRPDVFIHGSSRGGRSATVVTEDRRILSAPRINVFRVFFLSFHVATRRVLNMK